jgi:CheY-like chemotaxis protein
MSEATPEAPRTPESADDALLRDAHALRDREEAARVRQLGGILVHDLNNVLFALLGRAQLLERRATDPATAKAAREILETTRLLEAQVVRLHAACRRDEPPCEWTNARLAVAAALEDAIGALPPAIRPAGVRDMVAALPSDALFEGDAAQVAVAVAQLVSIHRGRASAGNRVRVQVDLRCTAGDAPRFELAFEDDAGAPPVVPAIPTLLGDAFSLDGLPLAAALRATRDFGGRVACMATARGLRTEFGFDVRRGVAIARFDATGAESADVDRGHRCEHEDECVPAARRVLIADDDPAVRAVLVAALEAVGDDVDTIADPGACDAHPGLGSFDVVVLDAGGGGLEALARLRARGVGVPVLVASGEIVERPGDALTRCVLKPVALDTLDRELASLARLRARE